MRITILGLGAVGGHLCVRLASAGHEVSAIARGTTLEVVRRRGLTLECGGTTENVAIRASDDARDLPTPDVVFVTVKATDPTNLARGLAPLLGAHTSVVFAQNGIPWWYGATSKLDASELRFLDPDGALHDVVDARRILGAVVRTTDQMVEPGVVVHRVPGPNSFLVAEADDSASARVAELRAVLASAGFQSPPIANVRLEIWRKMMTNMSASLLCLMTGGRCTIVRDDERIRSAYFTLAREAIAIASAHGIDTRDFDPAPFAADPPDHLPSIRQDFERGKPLELDAIVLAPQRFARAAGVATPALDTIAALAVHTARNRTVLAR